MRAPSRLIPSRNDSPIAAILLLAALIAVLEYLAYSASDLGRYVIVFFAMAFGCHTFVMNKREKRRLQLMASSREGESLCSFARSFKTRQTDTWVIRAAHQEIQQLLHSYLPHFPVRAFDSLLDDLHLDADDVEDLLRDIAARSGRALKNAERNPYFGKVITVADLVLFINEQPRIPA